MYFFPPSLVRTINSIQIFLASELSNTFWNNTESKPKYFYIGSAVCHIAQSILNKIKELSLWWRNTSSWFLSKSKSFCYVTFKAGKQAQSKKCISFCHEKRNWRGESLWPFLRCLSGQSCVGPTHIKVKKSCCVASWEKIKKRKVLSWNIKIAAPEEERWNISCVILEAVSGENALLQPKIMLKLSQYFSPGKRLQTVEKQ